MPIKKKEYIVESFTDEEIIENQITPSWLTRCSRCNHLFYSRYHKYRNKYCPKCVRKQHPEDFKMAPQFDKELTNFSEDLLHFIEMGVVHGWCDSKKDIPDFAIVKNLRWNTFNFLKRKYIIFSDKNGIYIFQENIKEWFSCYYLKKSITNLECAFEELHKLKFGHLLGCSNYDLKYEIEDFSKEINFITNILRKSICLKKK